MPVFNTESYLWECIDSILAQSISDWELIAVDDHSTDESKHILQKYAAHNPQIRVYTNEGHGIISALRTAMRHSSGELITRMDSDDIMIPNKLESLYSKLRDSGEGSVAVGLVEYFSDGQLRQGYLRYAQWLNELSYTSRNFDEIYKECTIPSPAWMMYRSDLERIGGFKRDVYPEDYDLAFRMYANRLDVVATQDVVHRWRDHEWRASRNDPNYSDNTFIPLKTHWFKEVDLQAEQNTFLWGVGSRGKKIADQMIRNEIQFRWFTNNPRKIGKEIYGIQIEPFETLKSEKPGQVINSIAALDAVDDIRSIKNTFGERYYAFC